MTLLFDNTVVKATPEYVRRLCDLLRAELSMMQEASCTNSDDWTWGLCFVGNMADARPYRFEFGGEEDKPQILGEQNIALVVKEEEGSLVYKPPFDL